MPGWRPWSYKPTQAQSWSSTRRDPGAENVRFSSFPPALFVPSAKPPSLVRPFFLPVVAAWHWSGYGAYATCDYSPCEEFNCSTFNRQVDQNRPNRQGAGRDPSTNWTSVRIVLSVPLIFFAHFSRPRAVSHEPDAQRIGS